MNENSGSLRLKLARDTIGVMVLKGGSMGLGFVISVLLARTLGVKEFGLYAFGWSFLVLLSTPATFGFPQLLVREIAANKARGEWGAVFGIVRLSRRIVILVSLVLVLLAGIGLWLFSGRLSAESVITLTIALVGVPFFTLVQLQSSSLRGLNYILEGEMVQMMIRPLFFLFLFGLIWLIAREYFNASLTLGLQVVATIVTLLCGGFLLNRYLNQQDIKISSFKIDPSWVRSAFWLLLWGLLNLIPQHSGVILLGVMRGSEDVGLFKVAYQSALLIPFGLVVINTVISPTLSQLYTTCEIEKLRKILLSASGVSLVFAFPLILTYLLAGSWFLSFIFGKEYAASAGVLNILSIGQMVNTATGPVALLLIMSEYESLATLSMGISASINVILNFLLIPIWGVQGAAIATSLGLIAFNLICLYFVVNRFKLLKAF